MAIYMQQFDGYIVDTPEIDFLRCDGKAFHFDEVNTGAVNNTANVQTITGGQGNYPLAYIETDKQMEMTYESSQFTLDIFEMANATNKVQGDVGILETRRVDIATGPAATLPFEVQAGSVRINGLEETTENTVATGKFKVAITESEAETAGQTTITFAAADVTVGDTIRVTYRRRVVDGQKVTVKTNSTTSKGEVTYHYPVYSDGIDCTQAAIKGVLHIYVPRVRITALPGFNNSYKSAGTNGITFSAIDPKRADKKIADYIYEPYDENGEIVNKSASESVDWN